MIFVMPRSFITFLETLSHRDYSFPAGKMIVDIDDEVTQLFTISSGLVHLIRYQADGAAVVLQRAGKGAILSEASVFFTRYHCAAVAIQPSELRAYPLKTVRALMESTPQAAQAFAKYLANEVRSARKRAEILALKTVSERLSAWLIWNGGAMPERGTWHHVADELSVSREALYRELSKRR